MTGVHPILGRLIPDIRLCRGGVVITVSDDPQVAVLLPSGGQLRYRGDLTLVADAQTRRSLDSLLALDALIAFGTGGTFRPLDSLIALVALDTGITLDALRPGITGRALRTGSTGRTLRPGRTSRTGRTLRSGGPGPATRATTGRNLHIGGTVGDQIQHIRVRLGDRGIGGCGQRHHIHFEVVAVDVVTGDNTGAHLGRGNRHRTQLGGGHRIVGQLAGTDSTRRQLGLGDGAVSDLGLGHRALGQTVRNDRTRCHRRFRGDDLDLVNHLRCKPLTGVFVRIERHKEISHDPRLKNYRAAAAKASNDASTSSSVNPAGVAS